MSNFSLGLDDPACVSDNSSPFQGTVGPGWLRRVRTEGWESRSSSPDTFIERPPPNSQGRSSYAGKGQGRQAWTCRWHKYIHILSVRNFIILPQEINLATLDTESYLKAWSCQGHRQRLLHTTGPEARHPGQNNGSSSSFPWQQALNWQLYT